MAYFVPFVTSLNPTFWNTVHKRKLHDWKLDESPKPITGQSTIYNNVGTNCCLMLDYDSFNQTEESSGLLKFSGELFLYNTAENFKAAATADNKKKLLEQGAQEIWDSITSRTWLHNPALLSKFFIIAFADLKRFTYYSVTCVPALIYPSEIKQEVSAIAAYGTDEDSLLNHQKKTSSQVFLFTKSSKTFRELSDLENQTDPDDVVIVVADPSPVAESAGWSIRNVLAAVAHLHSAWKHCHIIALRSEKSIGIKFSWAHPTTQRCEEETLKTVPTSVGWEKEVYKADLRKELDPKKQMEQAVNLNISLIKWRLHPDIQLERYSNLKVLIFGAGTLGCNIARCLIGWGIKNFSFVDNSNVSYSNTVRQSLAEFEDARTERGKAETAAAALKRIYPSIIANAHKLTVPMPGHTISENDDAQLEADVEQLENLVKEHDAIFLALDSREARWLPTVLANKHRKMVLSVAIGFDTYVIIRHGIGSRSDSLSHESSSERVPYSQLSCYFCSDVTAPGNSTADRTLDQQCTVSRPGTSMIASGFAAELLASVLQYPDPLETPASVDDNVTVLGAAPHQIRGFLSRFSQILPVVRRFERCVACGDAIAQRFKKDGWKFVRDVMNSPSRLEQVTGLDELQESINNIDIDFEDDED